MELLRRLTSRSDFFACMLKIFSKSYKDFSRDRSQFRHQLQGKRVDKVSTVQYDVVFCRITITHGEMHHVATGL
jgi:hypothetical protein